MICGFSIDTYCARYNHQWLFHRKQYVIAIFRCCDLTEIFLIFFTHFSEPPWKQINNIFYRKSAYDLIFWHFPIIQNLIILWPHPIIDCKDSFFNKYI